LDEKFNQALHNFRDKNGFRLSCFVLPKDSTIPGLSFVYDRNYPSPEMARHVLITPKDKEFDLNTYSEIGLCKNPFNEWQPFSFKAEGETTMEDYLPDLPDDPYLSIASIVQSIRL
jgi:hypothetical protein